MEYMTRYKRPQIEETLFDEDKVERAGYIPAEVKINQLIEAGERLGKFRKEQFDQSFDDEEDLNIDPTRNGNFDLADASQYSAGLKGKFEKNIEDAKKKKAEKPLDEVKDNEST